MAERALTVGPAGLAIEVLAALPDAVLVLGDGCTIEYASPAVEAIFGWSPAALVGRPVGEILPADRVAARAGEHDGAACAAAPRPLCLCSQMRGRRRDGREVDVDVTVNVMEHDGHRRVFAVVRDVSAQRDAERALERAGAELRATNEKLEVRARELAALDAHKDALLGHAAHDLRNPLGIIVGYANFLLDSLDTIEREELKEILSAMERSGRTMARLVDDLVDVSAIEAGTLRLELEEVDVEALLDEALAGVRGMASAKGIELVVGRPREGRVRCTLDPQRFVQVVENLATNAIKYSEPGRKVYIGLGAGGGRATLEVTDEGVGIAPEAVDRIFLPFEKARSAGTRGEKSFGLGLSIVKRIVDAHGGSIRLTSVLGRGSRFVVELPLTAAAPELRSGEERAP